jgi:hypothetical protein
MSLWRKTASDLPRMFHMELLNRGIFATLRGMFKRDLAYPFWQLQLLTYKEIIQ